MIITLSNKEINLEEKKIQIKNLKFYSENPRIYNKVHTHPNVEPTQDEIYAVLKNEDNVKDLKVDIKQNGGLTDPIIVWKEQVIEGNSRLAAYKMLAELNPDWYEINCCILPDEVSEDDIFAFIGRQHIVGKTEWAPVEKAGFLYRRKEESKRPIKAIALELGMSKSKAETMIDTYAKMVEVGDLSVHHYSHYEEMMKSKDLVNYDKTNPNVKLIKTLSKKIKDETFGKAEDIRKVVSLVKTGTDVAIGNLKEYLADKISLDGAYASIEKNIEAKDVKNKIETFKSYIFNVENIEKIINSDPNLEFSTKQIVKELSRILKLVK